MVRAILIAVAVAVVAPSLARAQTGAAEVIVTAERKSEDGYDAQQPLIGLRRRADFAVREVTIVGDTRDPDKRHAEIYDMIRGAIALAARGGEVELATGELVVEPLTLDNYRKLTLTRDSRPDTEKVSFLVKTRLTAGVDARTALDRITRFIKDTPTVGRAEMSATDDLTLSVVNPDQYRGAILDLVAADAHATAAKMGPGYAVQARGLDRPVEWARSSLADVFLYVPYTYVVVPVNETSTHTDAR